MRHIIKKLKKTIFLLFITITINGFSQTKQGEKVNWIECIGTNVTEFGGFCLATENNNARAYITNNCVEKVQVFYEFTGACYDNSKKCNKAKDIILSGNTKKRVMFCNVTENSGSIRVTRVVPVDQPSSKSSLSSDTKNQNEWKTNESLLGSTSQKNTSNNSSYQRQQESIYQKRQREAQERDQREREHYRSKQQQVNQVIQQGSTRVNNLKQVKNAWENYFSNVQDNLAREAEEDRRRTREYQLAEQRRYERERQILAEQNRLREIELERQRKEEAERRRINEAKRTFRISIQDKKIPLYYDYDKAFVLFVSFTDFETLLLIPAILHKNSDNQLPYKQDVINAIEKDRGIKNLNVYGVYSSFEAFKEVAINLNTQARNSYINITEAKRFEYGKPIANKKPKNSTQEDFWGNKKKKTSSTKTDDFWNN